MVIAVIVGRAVVIYVAILGVGVNRAGAFAEYLAIPAVNAFKIPDEISDDIAAIFDPYGNAVHTALSFEMVGEDVLITGRGRLARWRSQLHAMLVHVIL